MGGLSVLRALQATMRCVDFLYVADSAFAPYGDHDALWVKERSLRITEFLIASGASGVAVACNTSSAVALGALRENYPGARFV
ncbi:MAG: glutamate racemase, partial [Pseudorhodobacter sp.]|nr:glutamate racemase [Rhizobacter sp.]